MKLIIEKIDETTCHLIGEDITTETAIKLMCEAIITVVKKMEGEQYDA